MKPTKNCVYCPECQRTKMLFESEAKANNFMRFNSEEIEELNGRAPIRAYFCEACAGWHLTSSDESSIARTTPTQRAIQEASRMHNEYVRQKKLLQLRNKVNKINNIVPLVKENNYRSAYVVLTDVIRALNTYASQVDANIAEFQKILNEGPEIADIILVKMYNELENLKTMNDVSLEEVEKKKLAYERSIHALEPLGEKYASYYQKHKKLLKSI